MQQRRQPVTLTDVKSTGARNSPEVLENLAYYHRSPVHSTRDILLPDTKP